MDKRVYITITYGSIEDALVLGAVAEAAKKLRRDGITPDIIQIYMPGTKLRISVNGAELTPDEKLIEKILEKAYEYLVETTATETSKEIGYAAAATEKQ